MKRKGENMPEGQIMTNWKEEAQKQTRERRLQIIGTARTLLSLAVSLLALAFAVAAFLR